ncbi:MAG: hypothetical protein HOZ81_25770 [Streptomyces sp.]|nr:hypothetical protein [Streptomyces sp.]
MAEQLLMRDCMERHDFKVWLIRPEEVPEDVLREFPYVITDVDWAKKHGYGSDLQRQAAALAAADPNKRYFRSLSPSDMSRATTALHGSSTAWLEARLPQGGVMRRSSTGCVSEAERRLYGDLRKWYQVNKVADQLTSLRVQRVVSDPRFDQGVARWATCMRDRGYSYARPTEARKAAMARSSRTDRAHEIELATTEAICARESGFAVVIQQLEEQYRRELSVQYRSDLETKRALELAALPRAREMVKQAKTAI